MPIHTRSNYNFKVSSYIGTPEDIYKYTALEYEINH